MDGARFDTLTRRLATSRSRRVLLRSLAGGALAAMGLGRAAQASCPRETPIRCGATCVNLRTDPSNCGRCGRTCPAELCYAGRCLDECPSGFVRHAGTCVRTCPAGMVACGGECIAACPATYVVDEDCACVCPVGTVDCGDACRACCGDADCAAGLSCVAGACVCTGTAECCEDADCPNGFACGADHTCLTVCASNEDCAAGLICAQGGCAIPCADFAADCPGHCATCATLRTGERVCRGGSTGVPCSPVAPCPTGQVCDGGGNCAEICL